MTRPLRLRFAPSPTGFLHVGGARTAIFNLLHARRHGGKMLLRIEDTDVERSRQHHAEQIVSSLSWLGIEWDEGPFYQSDRLALYRDRAEELVSKGLAYRCYCSVEELESERGGEASGEKVYRYSGRCRTAAEAGVARTGESVIRFKVSPGPIEFQDHIRGDVRFDAELIEDFVLLRSDGHPTYHLSVVVDDIDMEITLVARGDDHLSNTPKHILLFRAFGAEVPSFAHLPLILGSDRKRLSKRSGATSTEEYRDLGILPEALFNFLTLLGWAPGSDLELFSREEATSRFDLSDVNKSAAVFDQEKLFWMNAQYLAKANAVDLIPHVGAFLNFEAQDLGQLEAVIRLYQPRARTLQELAEAIVPYFVEDEGIEYAADAVRRHLKVPDLVSILEQLHEMLRNTEPFDVTTTEAALRLFAESKGLSAGKLIHPLRLALTGRGASPPIFDVAAVLGKERTLRRLGRLIEMLPTLQSSL